MHKDTKVTMLRAFENNSMPWMKNIVKRKVNHKLQILQVFQASIKCRLRKFKNYTVSEQI